MCILTFSRCVFVEVLGNQPVGPYWFICPDEGEQRRRAPASAGNEAAEATREGAVIHSTLGFIPEGRRMLEDTAALHGFDTRETPPCKCPIPRGPLEDSWGHRNSLRGPYGRQVLRVVGFIALGNLIFRIHYCSLVSGLL